MSFLTLQAMTAPHSMLLLVPLSLVFTLLAKPTDLSTVLTIPMLTVNPPQWQNVSREFPKSAPKFIWDFTVFLLNTVGQ